MLGRFAVWIVELIDELHWRWQFARSQEKLGRLADRALAEYESGNTPVMTLRELLEEARRDYREGRTYPLDPDRL